MKSQLEFQKYIKQSIELGLPPRCPMASARLCERYFMCLCLIEYQQCRNELELPKELLELRDDWQRMSIITTLDAPYMVENFGYFGFCPEFAYDRLGHFATEIFNASMAKDIDALLAGHKLITLPFSRGQSMQENLFDRISQKVKQTLLKIQNENKAFEIEGNSENTDLIFLDALDQAIQNSSEMDRERVSGLIYYKNSALSEIMTEYISSSTSDQDFKISNRYLANMLRKLNLSGKSYRRHNPANYNQMVRYVSIDHEAVKMKLRAILKGAPIPDAAENDLSQFSRVQIREAFTYKHYSECREYSIYAGQGKRRRLNPMKEARPPLPASLRWKILMRDNFTCQKCGRKAPDVELQIDHKKAFSKSGTNSVENLETLCIECNIGKGDKDVLF